jgi:hypothetical protein
MRSTAQAAADHWRRIGQSAASTLSMHDPRGILNPGKVLP